MQIEPLEPRCHLSVGQLDTTFGNNGKLTLTPELGIQQWLGGTFLQPDGKLLVSSKIWRNGYELRRYTTDGKLDPTFGEKGMVHAYAGEFGLYRLTTLDQAIQEDGKILRLFSANDVMGRSVIQMLERRNGDGSLDETFGQKGRIALYQEGVTGTYEWAQSIELRPGGGVVVSGSTKNESFVSRVFTADGSPDTSYGTRGRILYRSPPGVKLGRLTMHRLKNGRTLFIGSDAFYDPYASQLIMVRFNAAGRLDKTFGSNGISRTFLLPSGKRAAGVGDWVVTDDGSVLVSVIAYGESIYAMRFGPRGRLDPTFGNGGRTVLHRSSAVDDSASVRLIPMPRNRVSFALSILEREPGFSWSSPDDILVGRLTQRGRLDKAFGNRGTTIIDLGGTDELASVRLLPDGDLLLLAQTDLRWAVAVKING